MSVTKGEAWDPLSDNKPYVFSRNFLKMYSS